MKLAQVMMFQLNGSHHSSQEFAALKEVGQVGDQNALRGDEDGAIENAKAVMAIIAMAFDHLRPSFSLWWSAGWSHPQLGGLQEEVGAGVKNGAM
jgi:hypothetical protein